MITYLALRLSNGDYYWGSTSMTLNKREKSHRKFKGNDHFHNSLKKYPDDWVFLEIFNEDTEIRETEKQMLSLHYGNPGCLNLSNEPQGWGTGKNHARNKNPQYWEHLKGENHPRKINPEKWNGMLGDNHWTRNVDKSVLIKLGERLPIMSGDSNPMKTPEVAKKVSKWRQGKNIKPWIIADEIYKIWISSGRPKPTAKAWSKNTGFPYYSLRSMVSSFLEGWIPYEDEEWISWKASLVP
jgi:predicted GIY-YIG superfamily endonuclease